MRSDIQKFLEQFAKAGVNSSVILDEAIQLQKCFECGKLMNSKGWCSACYRYQEDGDYYVE